MPTPMYRRQRMVGYGLRFAKAKNLFTAPSTPVLKKLLWTFVAVVLLVGGLFWLFILRDLPDISDIAKFSFKQATTITDRNGEVLYRIFEENRQYITYEEVSPRFVEAIVATEDQRFRENVGIDVFGIIRAGFTDITQGKTHGASTITQQLIKLIMLTPEKKLTRKLKEIILAVKIGSYIKEEISKTTKGLSQQEIDQKVKEKIMELYSNLIFFGNNAYGIEAASQTYFSVKAKDLTILQAAILAGIPQAPSRYDPFTNKGLLMGKMVVLDAEKNPVELTDALRTKIIEKVQTNIDNSNLGSKSDDQEILDFIQHVLDFKIEDGSGSTYKVNYELGRKDVVLARMLEEKYITEFELKKSFLEGLNFQFHRGSTAIKAPHFVFRVINQLEEQYSKEMLQKGGLTITTTLDSKIQKMAEDSILENDAKLKSNLANNSALLYMDSQNGDILAYVGSKDFNNEEIDGQVDIIQSPRQPGSTVKPLLYSLGFMKLPLTIDTPIYDTKIKIDKDEPNNADGTFWGLTTIRQALAGSRNIPAIKMFFNVGGETPVKKFFGELGISNLQTGSDFYGYPMAIGAAEFKMFDLATAYTHLSAFGKPAKPNPILEIRGPDNSLLYKKQVEAQPQVIPVGVASIIWKMLVDTANYPADRVPMFTAPGRLTFATKSGTTNVVKGKEKLPRDGWFVSYTPSKVLILRAGNTDGSPMYKTAYGGRVNSSTWKGFLKKMIDEGYITNELPKLAETKEVTISKLSGKLATADTPLLFTKQTLAYLPTAPTEADTTTVHKVEIDKLCNGTPTALTPTSDLASARYIQPETIMPDKRDLGDIVERWKNTGIEKYKEERGPIILTATTGACDRTNIPQGDVTVNIIKPLPGEKITRKFSLWQQSTSSQKMANMKVFLGDAELKVVNYKKSGDITDITTITVPDSVPAGNYELKLVVIDASGASATKSIPVTLIDADTTPPYLMDDKIKVSSTGTGYSIALLFADESSTVSEGTIKQGENSILGFNGNVAMFMLSNLSTPVQRTATDAANNKASGAIDLSKYAK